MKILNISGYTWDMGGPPKVIYDHAVEQLKQGAEVTIITPISEGQKLYPIPEGAKVLTFKRHWLARFWTNFSLPLYRWVRSHGHEYDVIHIHGIWHFAGLTPYLAGIKTAKCITIHGFLDAWAMRQWYLKKKIFALLFQKRILRNTELIHLISEDEIDDLSRFMGGYQHPNAVLIPNGIQVEAFENLPPKGTFRANHNIKTEQRIILFLSRLHVKKGLDILLAAFEQLSKKHTDCVLVLAGPDEGYLPEVVKFIEKHQLQDRIKWVGMLTGDDKLAAFADADVFTLTSYSEGFSIATLEALVSGVPSVLSDRVGFAHAIQANQAAEIVELHAASIKNGLEKILDNPTYSQQLAKNGKHLVKTHYDIAHIGNQLLREFEKIVHT